MPINSDLSGLPTEQTQAGNPPVKHPIIVTKLAETWYDLYRSNGDDQAPSMVEWARWRASWSGMCARAVQYNVRERDAQVDLARLLSASLGEDGSEEFAIEVDKARQKVIALAQTEPPTIADHWRFGLGSLVHEHVQAAVEAAFPGARSEVKVTIDDFGSATADLVIDTLRPADAPDTPDDGEAVPFRIVLELKSINGMGFKSAATSFKGPVEGPRTGALLQGAMSATELKADLLVIGYLSLENLSPDVAKRNGMDEVGRFAAEWHYTPEQFTPLAEAEKRRVRRILAVTDEGGLVPRQIPDLPVGARVDNPATGAWTVRNAAGAITNAGKAWNCLYCPWQSRCGAEGA